MKPCKGIKIDSTNFLIHEVEITSLEDMQACVGGLIELVRNVYLPGDNNDLFVDEEGLLKDLTNSFVICPPPYSNPMEFMGNGLIVAVDEEGDTVSTTLTAEDVAKWVIFITSGEQDGTRSNVPVYKVQNK